jgi:hypothetical protein
MTCDPVIVFTEGRYFLGSSGQTVGQAQAQMHYHYGRFH